MTEHPAAPTTEAGRALAARAKRQAFGNWEGIAQFEIPAIEAEARAAARKEVLDGFRAEIDGRTWHPDDLDRLNIILDSLSTDTREEPSDD